jgi:cytochrome c553
MKSLTISSLLVAVVLLASCSNSQPKQQTQTVVEAKADISKGFQSLQQNCFSCHSPNAAIQEKVAPTMAEIKLAYLQHDSTEAGFKTAMVNFLSAPTTEASLMPDAVKQYNLMPKMGFDEAQLNNIAAYIYQSTIEKPEWFAQVLPTEKVKHAADPSQLTYDELGLSYALQTKAILGKNLLNAINTKGTDGAVDFCSTKAYPLTDSMAQVLHANIKRVSDKNRNPKNAANELELKYISQAKDLLSKGEKIKPQVQEINGKMVGYYPIMSDKMCLQCHGQPKTQVLQTTLSKIETIYPSDKALGYDLNQLRGIWVVEMNKK